MGDNVLTTSTDHRRRSSGRPTVLVVTGRSRADVAAQQPRPRRVLGARAVGSEKQALEPTNAQHARTPREAPMKARIHAITLAVSDLERSLTFYCALGLTSPGIRGTEFKGDSVNPGGAVVMFTLDDGLILSLYPRSELAKDAGVGAARVTGSPFTIGHFVDSREQVDAVLAEAASAGGMVHGPTHERPWGIYSGHFSDPDGHMWEVLYFLPEDRDT
jgi:predicted lactoylglutathione lyase